MLSTLRNISGSISPSRCSLVGWVAFGIQYFSLPFDLLFTPIVAWQGFLSFLVIMAWTFLVQQGYALAKGARATPRISLKHWLRSMLAPSTLNAIAAGLTAALGEELFFRGFIQQKWGLLVGSVLFGFAHYERKIFASLVIGLIFMVCSLDYRSDSLGTY